MKREILCGECDQRTRPMHPEDVVNGYKRRRTQIRAKKPEVHTTTVTSPGLEPVVTHHASLICDGCGLPIEDGVDAYAHTTWNTHREPGEPQNWEQEYAQ